MLQQMATIYWLWWIFFTVAHAGLEFSQLFSFWWLSLELFFWETSTMKSSLLWFQYFLFLQIEYHALSYPILEFLRLWTLKHNINVIIYWVSTQKKMGLPWWLSGKSLFGNAGDMGLIPGLGRFPLEGNGSPLQHSCLVNSMERGAWKCIVCGISKEVDMT